MKHPFSALVLSMAVGIPIVNASAKDSPVLDHASTRPQSNVAKKDVGQLIGFLLKNGKDGQLKDPLASVIGLPGTKSAKGQNIFFSQNGANRNSLNCFLAYDEDPSDSSASPQKKPICLYLVRQNVSGQDDESQFFRINLEGRLEKVIVSRGKIDEAGKGVPGSAADTPMDINSPEVKKEFAAEWTQVMAWLKKQQPAKGKGLSKSVGTPAVHAIH